MGGYLPRAAPPPGTHPPLESALMGPFTVAALGVDARGAWLDAVLRAARVLAGLLRRVNDPVAWTVQAAGRALATTNSFVLTTTKDVVDNRAR